MDRTTETTGLDQILDQLTQTLTPDMAQVLVDFRADDKTQARMDVLAEKANDGTLTEAEKSEYDEAVRAGTLVSILQAKAKKLIRNGA